MSNFDQPGSDGFDSVVGMVSLIIGGDGPSLVFSRDIPNVNGVSATMGLSYDSANRRLRVRAGATTGDDDMIVDFADLPEEWKRLVEGGPENQAANIPLQLPECSRISRGNFQFLTYFEYQRLVRAGRFRGRGGLSGPGLVSELYTSARGGALMLAYFYPPLTRNLYQSWVRRCQARMVLAPAP